MNNVYLTCKIIEKGEVCFDYYNKLKPYVILKCLDLDKKDNVFLVLLYDMVYSKYVLDLKVSENVYILGSINIRRGINYVMVDTICII